MTTLIADLRSTIIRRVEAAGQMEILSIVGALFAEEQPLEFQPQKPKASAARAAGERFEVVADVVRDHQTGLEWTRKSVTEKGVKWAKAEEACATLELAGGGWRLPTQHELLSIVDYERHGPAIDPIFECKAAWYWSSTPYAPDGDYAWLVYFNNGNAYALRRDDGGFVRAVRGGQF